MNKNLKKHFTLSLILPLAAMALAHADPSADSDLPKHQLPASKDGNLVVGNCDGKSSIEIPGKKPGDRLSDSEARQVSKQLMEEWQKKNPGAHWISATESARSPEVRHSQAAGQAEGPVDTVAQGESKTDVVSTQHGVYSNFTAQDRKIWEIEQTKLVAQGKAIFHSADRLASKTAISCDMCHPNAANTHAETYPKFQVQLQRVAMLRDMINWCIENPVKGVMLRDEDPKMKALEAYIIYQRKGVALDPGKH